MTADDKTLLALSPEWSISPVEIKLSTVQCPHCGYKWVPRSPRPPQCPSCKKYIKWPGKKPAPSPKNPVKCSRCGYEWIPRVEKPKVCNRCGSPMIYLEGPAAEIFERVMKIIEQEEGRA